MFSLAKIPCFHDLSGRDRMTGGTACDLRQVMQTSGRFDSLPGADYDDTIQCGSRQSALRGDCVVPTVSPDPDNAGAGKSSGGVFAGIPGRGACFLLCGGAGQGAPG